MSAPPATEHYRITAALRIIHSEAEVLAQPDGCLLCWDRIPGDPTSAAIAFFHIEDDTAWVSPGGWDPQPISVLRYPLTALLLDSSRESAALREVIAESDYPSRSAGYSDRQQAYDEGYSDGTDAARSQVLPLLPERTDADYRDRALTLAVQISTGMEVDTDAVMSDARTYEAYLRGGAQ